MNPDPTQPAPTRRTRQLVGLGVTALVVAMIVLHLTGVVGPGSH